MECKGIGSIEDGEFADAGEQHFDGRLVQTAAREDHIGVALARLDELFVARAHRFQVLGDDAVGRAAALGGVAL